MCRAHSGFLRGLTPPARRALYRIAQIDCSARNTPIATVARISLMQSNDTDLAELAGGFIHELKNHLSTLGLNLQLLAEDFAEPQNHRERRALSRVQRLQGECQRLVDVAHDFLRFARIKDLDLVATDLGKVVEEM